MITQLNANCTVEFHCFAAQVLSQSLLQRLPVGNFPQTLIPANQPTDRCWTDHLQNSDLISEDAGSVLTVTTFSVPFVHRSATISVFLSLSSIVFEVSQQCKHDRPLLVPSVRQHAFSLLTLPCLTLARGDW